MPHKLSRLHHETLLLDGVAFSAGFQPVTPHCLFDSGVYERLRQYNLILASFPKPRRQQGHTPS